MKQSITILGIDPGFAIVGWGLIQKTDKGIEYRTCGAIITDKNESFNKRLSIIYEQLQEIITVHRPNIIAIEQLYFSKNAKTALAVGHARGVILLAAEQNKIPVAEYGPLTVKQTITGDGKAEKKQMQSMVKQILHLNEIPKPDDIADAVAIALTHAYQVSLNIITKNNK